MQLDWACQSAKRRTSGVKNSSHFRECTSRKCTWPDQYSVTPNSNRPRFPGHVAPLPYQSKATPILLKQKSRVYKGNFEPKIPVIFCWAARTLKKIIWGGPGDRLPILDMSLRTKRVLPSKFLYPSPTSAEGARPIFRAEGAKFCGIGY